MNFCQELNQKILDKNSRLCVGLDPRLEWIPKKIKNQAVKKLGKSLEAVGEAIYVYNCEVVDIIEPYVSVIKPQIAFYEQYGIEGIRAFAKTIQYAKEKGLLVIADAKRGDIDSTAQAYAKAFLGKAEFFGRNEAIFDSDALTVNPYMGEDSLLPFIESCKQDKKGIFVLIKTSNPGSKDLQNLKVDGDEVYKHVAKIVARHSFPNQFSPDYSNIGAVVGATFPQEAKEIRQILPNSIFLVPGIGTQGGDFENIKNFFNDDGLGAIINSSREVVFPERSDDDKNYQENILKKAKYFIKKINENL